MQVTFTTPLIAGEIADYYFEDGILYSLSKSVKRTVENISNNVTLIKKITGNKPVPLLIYLSKSPVRIRLPVSFHLKWFLKYTLQWLWFQNPAWHC